MLEPKPLKLDQLETIHPEYVKLAPIWRTISTLREGFSAIRDNVERYLPRRPVEDDELYQLRVSKLAYTPIMSSVVNTYTGKLARAAVDFPDTIDSIWAALRVNNAKPSDNKRSESSFLAEVFEEVLYFGRCHISVDLPTDAAFMRSAFELRDSGIKPYFQILSPLEVVNWGDGWMVTRQYIDYNEAFADPQTTAIYSYYSQGATIRYRVPVQLGLKEDRYRNKYQSIAKVLKDGEWVSPHHAKDITYPPEIIAGAGIERIVSTRVADSGWLCSHLYNKQIQHTRIENSWTDTGYLAGTIQRVFTPSDPTPNDDPRVSYSTDDLSTQLAKVGNQHILVGKAYQFVESTGVAIGNLQAQLDKVEEQIKTIAHLHFASTSAGVLQQSGKSKQIDQSLLNGVMAQYGVVLIDTYNALLARSAAALGIVPIEVSGLSDFADDEIVNLADAVSLVSGLSDFPLDGKQKLYAKLLESLGVVYAPDDVDKVTLETPSDEPTEA